jgi:hypothetical protein
MRLIPDEPDAARELLEALLARHPELSERRSLPGPE